MSACKVAGAVWPSQRIRLASDSRKSVQTSAGPPLGTSGVLDRTQPTTPAPRAPVPMRPLSTTDPRHTVEPPEVLRTFLSRDDPSKLNGKPKKSSKNGHGAVTVVTPMDLDFAAGSNTPTSGVPLATRARGFAWESGEVSPRWRALAIWRFILALRTRLWLMDQPATYPGGVTEAKKAERQRAVAAWAREQVLELGPVFIKLGQLFSTRSDLFPAAVTQELAQLQDRVPAFSSLLAVATVEEKLGMPVARLFRSFDRQPLAAASLGQVHRVVLLSGEEAVVKVQRPGLRRLFDMDLAVLRLVAEQLDRGDPARDTMGIFRECEAILNAEIDYIAEGRNADRFRRNFAGVPWVRVPRVVWSRTAPAVLCLEYMPSTKISDATALRAAGLDTGAVARRATEAEPRQDRNIGVDTRGALVFYDFGMMSEIGSTNRENLSALFYAVYRKDAGAVVDALCALGIVVTAPGSGDTTSLRRAIAFGLDNLTRQVAREETLGAIGEDMFALALDQPFRFPAAFTFVLRAFTTLEGVGKSLDPKFRFAAVAAPFAQQLLAEQDVSASRFFLEELGQQASTLGLATAEMPGRVARVDKTMSELARGDLKLRVRALDLERAARRASVMQGVTLNAVAGGTALNLALQLGTGGSAAGAGVLMAAAATFGALVWRGLWRVRRLDKFEKGIKS